MRPHHLRLTAFGPFAGEVAVDLDALGAAGLFLLHGPTGAGKTTLLDGIGFALFGRVPGVRGEAKRLRSDYAEAGTRTEVRLEATLAGRRVRVTRSPAWERAKTRGTGTTTEPARVLLEERVDGAWECLSTRPREADDEIADLVGMSAEQFFQVVLLPQGEFAQFLRASSADRGKLLQRLFSTERFADVEGWLATRRRTTEAQVGAARGAVDAVVERVSQVAGVPVPEATELSQTRAVEWATNLLEQAVDREGVSAELVAGLGAVRDAARLQAEAAVQLADRQRKRTAALARAAALEAELPTRLALQVELEAASRAAEVAGVLAACTQRREQREQALTLADRCAAGLDPVGLTGASVEQLRLAIAAGRERAGRLDALRAVEAARRTAVDEAARAVEEQADALAEVGRCELALAVLPDRRAQAADRLSATHAAAATAPVLRAERDRLVALRPDVVALATLTSQIRYLEEQSMSAREAAVSLERKALELRVASVNSMVARLAFRLADGIPCEVCGSREHPDPSALRDEGVSSDDEERAQQEADAAEQVAAALGEQLAAARATATTLAERVGDLTLDGLDTQVAALDLELDVLEAAVARLADAAKVVDDLEAEHAAVATAQVTAAARAHAAQRRAADAGDRAQVHADELAAALAPDLDLESALTRTAVLVAAADAALTTSLDLVTATAELDAAVAATEQACHAAGFSGIDAAEAATRPAAWREDAATRLRAAADLSAAVAAELADPDLDVPLQPAAPVAETSAALVAADADLSAAAQVLGERRQRRTSLAELVPALQQALVELGPVAERAREVRALADLCAGAGANGLKMTLTSFVLAARLEEVAAAASVRLLRMTQGRYSLVHTDGGARGGARSGLGLLARDGWSGQDRDTATLSGGETFLASLALALGLADVVTAEAGGARIGALFVDEGFGTLDEETLDEVMDVLDGLREGGRLVGLVSHVSELRQRIPAQVHVTKTRTGSDLVLRGC